MMINAYSLLQSLTQNAALDTGNDVINEDSIQLHTPELRFRSFSRP